MQQVRSGVQVTRTVSGEWILAAMRVTDPNRPSDPVSIHSLRRWRIKMLDLIYWPEIMRCRKPRVDIAEVFSNVRHVAERPDTRRSPDSSYAQTTKLDDVHRFRRSDLSIGYLGSSTPWNDEKRSDGRSERDSERWQMIVPDRRK